jgi:tetratricopeptide (TPR) repeat protein
MSSRVSALIVVSGVRSSCEALLTNLEPNFYPAHFWLGQIYEKKGLHREAIAAYEKALSLSNRSPEVLASLSHAYAISGDKTKATKILDELTRISQRRYVSPYFIALIHEGLGDKDRAIEWLRRTYQDRSRSVPFLKVDPMLDRLRSEPDFAELLRQDGLAPER